MMPEEADTLSDQEVKVPFGLRGGVGWGRCWDGYHYIVKCFLFKILHIAAIKNVND